MYANTPKPPYYAVIFTSVRIGEDQGYCKMSEKIEALVKEQPGFLGMESVRNDVGITVCYWKDMDSIKKWARDTDHKEAKRRGMATWYESYKVRISKVEIEY